jgi:hypothetical protein
MGLLYPYIVTVFFDERGDILREEKRRLTELALRSGSAGIFDDTFQHYFLPDIDSWMKDVGYQEADILVNPFRSHEHQIAVETPEQYWLPVLEGPIPDPHLTGDDVQAIIKRWKDDGRFALWWGNDYEVDRTGRIVGS